MTKTNTPEIYVAQILHKNPQKTKTLS